ncbi:MAG: anaerobic ribonucleoside-triphosphate reductase activating protein [Negativicutes bacterium]|nr:anaerobic ribonucleoside-triphosphate reductase activating protein [Negativicutes bacterium]
MEVRIAGIEKESVVDGPGLRFVIFSQGCPHLCPGCHNPHTHDPNGGRLVDIDEILTSIKQAKLIRGVTFSGGEPFIQASLFALLAEQIKPLGLDIVTYSGFLFEQLVTKASRDLGIRQLLAQIDILVDGPYRVAERDLGLAFRGSRNQRLVDVPRSLALERIVLWEDKAAQQLQWA